MHVLTSFTPLKLVPAIRTPAYLDKLKRKKTPSMEDVIEYM